MSTFAYLLSEPGPGDWGSMIDAVPSPSPESDISADHARWRRAVEAELAARLNSGQLSIWYPLMLPDDQPIVPLFGGDPSTDWIQALTVLIDQSFQSGSRIVRVVDLSRHEVWAAYEGDARRSGTPYRVLSAKVQRNATTSALFGGLDSDDLCAMVIDIVRATDDRSGRNRAVAQQRILKSLARCFGSEEVTVTGLAQAAVYSLSLDASGVSLSSEVLARLDDYHHRHVSQRRNLEEVLDELDGLLAMVSEYDVAGPPTVSGQNRSQTVTLRGVSGKASGVSKEFASDLLAVRLAREMMSLDRGPNITTVVIGADAIASPVLDMLTAASLRSQNRLFLFYEHFAGPALEIVGSAGASVGGFFRLGNNAEAMAAADFMGKQHRFELSSISLTQGKSFEWGWSTSVGTDRSTSRSWETGSMFAATLSSSVSRSRSSTTSGGTGASSGRTVDYSRVHEYILEPSTFQKLPPGSLLVVDVASQQAALASCGIDIHRSKLASRTHVMGLGQ